MSRSLAVFALLAATLLWGFAFVAQKSAMDHMGPLTFSAVRYILGSLITLPFALIELRRRKVRLTRRQWLLTALLSGAFFLGVWLQQVGISLTTVTNSGFLTSLYVLFVPAIAFLAMRLRPHPIIYLGAPLALIGIYLLNGATLDALNVGDGLVVAGALFWGIQVFLIGHLARETGLPVFLSVVSFITVGVISTVLAPILETPHLDGIATGWVEIAYAGILSTAVAFTLQAVGQQHVPAANAAIILSAESLFAAIGGAIVLGERLSLIGYGGAALIFLAIVMVETVPALQRRREGAVA